MHETLTLVMTDVVDSTQLHERLGDAAMGRLWAMHDTLARGLMRAWQGREIGRSDGFMLLFDAPAQALGFAQAYHRALAGLAVPIKARVGIHLGPVSLRENPREDTDQGATPFEVDGIAVPVAARVSAAALGGQTLATGSALQALDTTPARVKSHGHWRLKGLTEPLELFEVGEGDAPFMPPPDSAKAYRVVRRGDNWATLQNLPNNLPAERDSFIGRQELLKGLARAFDEGARLVTLLGIGGIGKTRLALTHARCWLGDYPGGGWFCDLKAARSLDGIVHAVAQSLEMPLSKGDPVQLLGAAIVGRGSCLIILDNFEQVARHGEATIGVWLERAPAARFIVTSREVLGIVGEKSMVLAPLAADEAADLFRQRVRAAGVPAAFDAAEDEAIPPLMELLDRLPLAIELAAARGRVMRPRVLLQRMDERFKLLAARGGRHDRQATLRAMLDWSWDLLSVPERSALAQLAVFEGSIALDAAEAVIQTAASTDEQWVPDLLQALVEKSLLRPFGAQRFDMLRTVHDYASERLVGSGMAADVETRHWRHFAAIDEVTATAERGAEVDNLVFACRRAAVPDPEAAVALLRNAWAALRLTGPFRTAVELGQAVEAGMPADDPRRAIVDRVVGAALSLLGDVAGARRRYLSALNLAAQSGDTVTQAQAQCLLAELELARGDTDAAAVLLRDAEQSPAARADPTVRYMCLNGLGKLHMLRSRWSASRSCYAEALTLAESLGNRRWQGGLQGNLGMIARAEGRREDARRHWQMGLGLASEVGDRQWAGNTHCNLGLLLHELGEGVAATSELQTALDIARTIGHRRLEATALCNLGLVAEARGDDSAARDHHAHAAQVAEALGDHRLEGQARGYLGLSMAMLGHHDQAAAELDRAQTLLRPHGDPSALALVLLQSAVASAARGDAPGAQACIDSARDWMAPLTDSVDPDVASMLARAERALGPLRPRHGE